LGERVVEGRRGMAISIRVDFVNPAFREKILA